MLSNGDGLRAAAAFATGLLVGAVSSMLVAGGELIIPILIRCPIARRGVAIGALARAVARNPGLVHAGDRAISVTAAIGAGHASREALSSAR